MSSQVFLVDMIDRFTNPLIQEAYKRISSLPKVEARLSYHDGVHIDFQASQDEIEQIRDVAKGLKPWRKGPFYLNELHIDSEWRSFIKWGILASRIKLEDKDVADVGCNNGYYLYEMLKHKPRSLTGFDPGEIFYAQFCFLQHFLHAPIVYERLGIEHLAGYEKKFDVIFCLGVLYHRSDPIAALKSLSRALRPDGEIILDTLIIDDEREIALFPKESYAKMRNIYFIPSVSALRAWCYRARLELVEVLDMRQTTIDEQRKTEWIDSLSLDSFLAEDLQTTIEGYPMPKRGYFRLKRSE